LTALLKAKGLPATPNAFIDGLGSSKFNLPMFDPTKTGSVGDALGVIYVNVTKFPVGDLEFVMNNLTDTFAGSMGTNGSWNVAVTPPDAAKGKPATLTITAADKASAIQPNQYLWLMVPAAPSDSDPKKPDQFTVNLTPAPPKALPAPKPPEKRAPGIGTDKGSVDLSFDAQTGALTFGVGKVSRAWRLDGSSTTMNGPHESIIGSSIVVQPSELIGRDPQIPGAFDFANALVQIMQGGTLYAGGTLTNIRVYETGSGSELVGELTWQSLYPGLDSRYLLEDWTSPLDDVFFDGDLIGATHDFTQDAVSLGELDVASVATPEPPASLLLAFGAAALAGLRFARRGRRGPAGEDFAMP
jgi:hypothetical protein